MDNGFVVQETFSKGPILGFVFGIGLLMFMLAVYVLVDRRRRRKQKGKKYREELQRWFSGRHR